MDEQQLHKLKGRELRLQWWSYRQRQYEYRLAARFVIRLGIWLLGAWLVQDGAPSLLPLYLLLSLGALGAVVRSSSATLHRKEETRVASPEAATSGPDQQEELEGAGEGEDEYRHRAGPQPRPHKERTALGHRGREKADKVRSAPGHDDREASEREDEDSAAPDFAAEPPSANHAAARNFAGVLTLAQQRALLLSMQQLQTSGATRCAMDAAFRLRLLKDDTHDTAVCLCGSGAAFGSCCAPVKDELVRIITEV